MATMNLYWNSLLKEAKCTATYDLDTLIESNVSKWIKTFLESIETGVVLFQPEVVEI